MLSNINVLIISHKRREMLEACIHSLELAFRKTEALCEVFEIKIAFNADIDSFSYFQKKYQASKYLLFYLIDSPLTPAAARNFLLDKTSEAWVLFLDDDTAVPENYFLEFFKIVKAQPEVKILGGPNINFKNSSSEESLQGLVLGSWWGSGPFFSRYSPTSYHKSIRGRALILCQLWVYKEYSQELHFEPKLLCAEENEFFARNFKKYGIKYYYFPQLEIYHHRRKSILEFFGQCAKFGKGRAQWILTDSPYLSSPWLLSAFVGIPCSFFWSGICGLFQAIYKRNLKLGFSIFKFCCALQIGYLIGIIQGFYLHTDPLTRRYSIGSSELSPKCK